MCRIFFLFLSARGGWGWEVVMMNYSGNEVSASKLFAQASYQSRQLSITGEHNFNQQTTFKPKHYFAIQTWCRKSHLEQMWMKSRRVQKSTTCHRVQIWRDEFFQCSDIWTVAFIGSGIFSLRNLFLFSALSLPLSDRGKSTPSTSMQLQVNLKF